MTGRLVVTLVALVSIASVLVAATVTPVMRDSLTDRLDDQLSRATRRSR